MRLSGDKASTCRTLICVRRDRPAKGLPLGRSQSVSTVSAPPEDATRPLPEYRVRGASGQGFGTVSGERNADFVDRMHWEHLQTFATLQIPDSELVMEAAREGGTAVRRKRDAGDGRAMPGQGF